MALSLQRGGFAVLGTDAAAETRAALAAEGIETTESPRELCARCDAIILSLPNAAIVEAVVLGEDGLLAHARPGLLVVDTSTSHPDTTRRLGVALAAAGVDLIDAPVSGGPKGALAATMTMVIGGTDAAVARAEPVLAVMSAKRVHVGGSGAGHITKIVNNLLCAAHLLTAGEAIRLARAAGLAPERLLEGINAGSGRSAITQVNFPTWILNDAFDSGFTMKLMRKDVGLAEDLIGTLDLDLPVAAEVVRLWRESVRTLADGEDFNRIAAL